MNDLNIPEKPAIYDQLVAKCKEIGFSMPSDVYTGALLKALVTSKPNGHFLELGTGIGLSLSWMAAGMDAHSKLISVDNDPELVEIARSFFHSDERISLICADGTRWLNAYDNEKFDLIFADAWPGKYSEVDQTLALLKPGGFYVIDDMMPQANWLEGHQQKAEKLIAYLESRNDFNISKMNWSTGIVLAIKKP